MVCVLKILVVEGIVGCVRIEEVRNERFKVSVGRLRLENMMKMRIKM